jgi:formyl-CoA transferase
VGLAELADDPDFRTNVDRVANRDRLIPILEERMRTRTSASWLEILARHEVPAAPVNDLSAALAEPTLSEGGAIVDVPYEPLGHLRMLANPSRIAGVDAAYTGPPQLGEHSDQILHEVAGYDGPTIDGLFEQGIVRSSASRARDPEVTADLA